MVLAHGAEVKGAVVEVGREVDEVGADREQRTTIEAASRRPDAMRRRRSTPAATEVGAGAAPRSELRPPSGHAPADPWSVSRSTPAYGPGSYTGASGAEVAEPAHRLGAQRVYTSTSSFPNTRRRTHTDRRHAPSPQHQSGRIGRRSRARIPAPPASDICKSVEALDRTPLALVVESLVWVPPVHRVAENVARQVRERRTRQAPRRSVG